MSRDSPPWAGGKGRWDASAWGRAGFGVEENGKPRGTWFGQSQPPSGGPAESAWEGLASHDREWPVLSGGNDPGLSGFPARVSLSADVCFPFRRYYVQRPFHPEPLRPMAGKPIEDKRVAEGGGRSSVVSRSGSCALRLSRLGLIPQHPLGRGGWNVTSRSRGLGWVLVPGGA